MSDPVLEPETESEDELEEFEEFEELEDPVVVPPVEAAPEPVVSAAAAAVTLALGKTIGEDAVSSNAPLGELTTYRVGGHASVLAIADSLEDLAEIHRAASTIAPGVPFLVVGLGSNLLVADEGFSGVAIQLGEGFTAVVVEGNQVIAGAGAKLPVVARKSGAAGLSGFEWAVGVPGSVGGAVRMNAGGHGSDMRESLVSATLFNLRDGSTRTSGPDELGLGYRCSNVAAHEVVVSARLQLSPGDESASKKQMTDIVRWRLMNQPGGQNAGSVFTNPEGDSAGRLIDAAGLKGHRIGTAEVSTKHANFIQADPDGLAADVVALMAHIVAEVRSHAGVELHAETRMVGFKKAAPGDKKPR